MWKTIEIDTQHAPMASTHMCKYVHALACTHMLMHQHECTHKRKRDKGGSYLITCTNML